MEGVRDNLVPIGRFAFMTGLTRRALRLYDERALLRPAVVDDWTGYRYYSLDQIDAGEWIRRLRAVDLPLDEVKVALADPARLDELLDHHEARLRGRMAESERALALLQFLREKKEEEKPMPIPVEIREVPALKVACVEIHSALDRVGTDCQQAFGRLMSELGPAGISPIGPSLMAYPEEDFDPESFRVLVGVPIGAALPMGSDLKIVDFAGGKAAVGTLVGPYEGLHQAWTDVHSWIAEHGLEIIAMPYELYRVDPMRAASPAEIETDIVVPVA